jgi:hypothetical protein
MRADDLGNCDCITQICVEECQGALPVCLPFGCSPALLSRKSLVQQVQHLGDIELDIFKVEIFLVVFLHL